MIMVKLVGSCRTVLMFSVEIALTLATAFFQSLFEGPPSQ